MTTETTTPTPTPKLTNAVLIGKLSWFAHHLILLAVAAGLVFGAVYFVENLISKRDDATASKYAAILATQTAQTQAVEKQLATDEANWTQVEQTLLAQNAQLSKSIANENAVVAKQRQTDATLTAQQTADRLSQQVKAAPGEITANGNSVIADLPIARSIVSNLDLLVGTQSELADTQTQLKNETTVAANAQSDVAAQANVIVGLKATNADEIKACSAQVTAIKASARKGGLKWFLRGFVTGLVTGIIGKRLAVGTW